jgi:hypothetical protein
LDGAAAELFDGEPGGCLEGAYGHPESLRRGKERLRAEAHHKQGPETHPERTAVQTLGG